MPTDNEVARGKMFQYVLKATTEIDRVAAREVSGVQLNVTTRRQVVESVNSISRWGITKFKQEKYWESKEKAYETVLNHFERIDFWGRSNRAQAYCAVTVGDNDLHPHTFNESMRTLAQLEVTAFVYFENELRDLSREYRQVMGSIHVN